MGGRVVSDHGQDLPKARRAARQADGKCMAASPTAVSSSASPRKECLEPGWSLAPLPWEESACHADRKCKAAIAAAAASSVSVRKECSEPEKAPAKQVADSRD